MAVAFEEFNDSPTFSGTAESRSATRHGKVAWGDINDFVIELFPSAIAGIPRLPARMPGFSGLFANNYSIKPLHPDSAIANAGSGCSTSVLNTHDDADVTVGYQTIPFQQDDPNSDQIYTIQKSISAELMTLRNVGLKWDGEADTIKDPEVTAAKNIPMVEWNVTLHRVPNPPEATYRSLIGKVNSSSFLGAASETLLFVGAAMIQTVTSDETLPWQVDLHFVERIVKQGAQQVGWNHFFRDEQGHGNWQRIKTANGDDIYPTGNFGSLI